MDFLLKILYYGSSGVSVRLISFFFLAGLYNNSPSETWVHIEIIPIFTVCDCCSKVLPSEKAVSEVAAAGGGKLLFGVPFAQLGGVTEMFGSASRFLITKEFDATDELDRNAVDISCATTGQSPFEVDS